MKQLISFKKVYFILVVTILIGFLNPIDNYAAISNNDLTIGGINIKNDIQTVERILGKPTNITKRDTGCTIYNYNDELFIFFLESNGSIIDITSKSYKYGTARGVSPGAVSRRITDYYGYNYQVFTDHNSDIYNVIYSNDLYYLSFIVNKKTDLILEVTVASGL